jgi:nicotinate-nucleotide adenylyltransferase
MTSPLIGKPVGILGGSFDPVHFGHLRLALECLQQADLGKVIFIPLNSPPHRRPLQASTEQRLHMLELAILGAANFEVSDMEIQRKGITYTIDTLKQLRGSMDRQSLCLILGMDAFQEFDNWKGWQTIPDYAHLIIVDRPDAAEEIRKETIKAFLESRLAFKKEELHNSPSGKVFRLNVPLLDISSSRIRDQLHAEASAMYLLPDKVLEFINKERIY